MDEYCWMNNPLMCEGVVLYNLLLKKNRTLIFLATTVCSRLNIFQSSSTFSVLYFWGPFMIYKLPLHLYQITVWVYECKSDSFKKQKVKVMCKIKCLFTASERSLVSGEDFTGNKSKMKTSVFRLNRFRGDHPSNHTSGYVASSYQWPLTTCRNTTEGFENRGETWKILHKNITVV